MTQEELRDGSWLQEGLLKQGPCSVMDYAVIPWHIAKTLDPALVISAGVLSHDIATDRKMLHLFSENGGLPQVYTVEPFVYRPDDGAIGLQAAIDAVPL